jgi:GTPase SAR1 family protein
MATTREEAHKQIKDIGLKYGDKLKDANEAKTRLLLVDEILKIFGWSPDEFRPETKSSPKSYIDYLLTPTTPDNTPRLVVEAKRVSHTFGGPRFALRKTEYALSYLQGAFGPSLTEVIDQARRYCEETGVPYAAITNGSEWLVTHLIPPPGRSIADLKCLYLGNLLADDAPFDAAWEALGRTSIIQGGVEETFDGLNRLEYEFYGEPRIKLGDWWGLNQGSTPSPQMREFYDRFFDEITDPRRRTMLEHCFVSSSRLDQYESAIKHALSDIAPKYIADADELEPGDSQKLLVASTGDRKGRVVLVVGSVGVGKTTFITKIFTTTTSNKSEFFRIDLINETDVTSSRIWSQLLDWIRNKSPHLQEYTELRQIFHRDLEALRRGPFQKLFEKTPDDYTREEAKFLQAASEDPERYVRAMFQYLQKNRTSMIVFLDNADRLTESSQREIYNVAHQLAQTGAAVIVPMRETTYYRAKEAGFLDVRSSDLVFHLQAPDLAQVLSKRVQYVHKQLSDTPDHPDLRLREWRQSNTWNDFREASLRYAEELKTFILQSQHGRNALELLASVAWHSVRRFFCCLRHTHSAILSQGLRWDEDGIVSALILREDGTATPFIPTTLFIAMAPRQLAHLLRIRLLLFLQHGVSPWEARAGITYRRLLEVLRAYGYRKAWVDSAIFSLVRERMLECVEFPNDADYSEMHTSLESHSFKASPLSIAVCRTVQFSRTYLAASGWGLGFLDSDRHDEFVTEGNSIKSLLTDNTDTPLSVGLLSGSRLSDIVISYLHDITESECLLNERMKDRTDIGTTEHELERVQRRWEDIVPDLAEHIVPASSNTNEDHIQMLLPAISEKDSDVADIDFGSIARPKNLGTAKLCGRSRTGALILWALVALRISRRNVASGADIAGVINQYGVDDQSKVLSTNVSKTLRSALLRTQRWLTCYERGGQPRYGLGNGWEEDWRVVFGEDPPQVK